MSQLRYSLTKYAYIVDLKYYNLTLKEVLQYNSSTYFIYDKQCYLQCKDLAMRISTFSVFTNFYMTYNKKNFAMKFDKYIRYIDDIFVLRYCKERLSEVYFKQLLIT